MKSGTVLAMLLLLTRTAILPADELRSAAHQAYAKSLWEYITKTDDYSKWRQADEVTPLDLGPLRGPGAATYRNSLAQQTDMPHGSVVVTEHRRAGGEKTALTVAVRSKDGYDPRTGDWYWAHFLSDGTLVKSSADKSPHNKRGFVTFEDQGRLWVFTTDSPELSTFLGGGELAKHVIRPGAGPARMTLKSPDAETIDAYLVAKSGFVTKVEDGRLWVFRENSPEWQEFRETGEPAKQVIRPGAGPLGMTIKGPDAETIDAYLN